MTTNSQKTSVNPKVHEINACRICGNDNLISIIDLGVQSLTGVFPRPSDPEVTAGPLELVKCHSENPDDCCGLVQLRHSYESEEMYGANYGYRSGLNQSMVNHLHAKVDGLLNLVTLTPGDLVIDIGSNDGTTLSFYPENGATLAGIDPTSAKFKDYYRPDIHVIPDFFSAARIREQFGERKAKIVTSIAMFYDLEDPMAFVREIADILADDGIWHFEQSYLPTMLCQNSYDTICHEHVEYYALHQIKWMTDRAGLKIIDVALNDVNGGSFSVTVAHKDAPYTENTVVTGRILRQEKLLCLGSTQPYQIFKDNVFRHRDTLHTTLKNMKASGASILGYGASTKGNVILQFCGLTARDIPAIAEVNKDKFGCITPGTRIPIISEDEAHATRPDYLLVLPWHFRANLLAREEPYIKSGGKMLFPLPEIEIVGK
jgi:hypothetical protein